MNARLFASASLIALGAGCTAAGGTDDPGAGFRVDQIEVADDGSPYFLRGELGRLSGRLDDLAAAPAALAGALPAIAEALRVPAADLLATRVERDALGMTHVRFAQQKHGLRVVGGDVVVHITAAGAVSSVNSTAKDRAIDPSPAISAAAARGAAVQATAGHADAHQSELVYVISTGDGELHLAWEVLVIGTDALLVDFVYVDALTGRVVDRRPQVHTAKSRLIKDAQGQSYPTALLTAPQIGAEGSPPADPIGLAAYDNTGGTFDCFQTLFQRDSYDGAGAQLTSTVHIVFPTGGGGTSGNNAAWFPGLELFGIPPQMVYGDGDGNLMTPLARAYDVTAHELTHAVTTATANLTYMNESGALNEGLSDILAAVCEAWKDQAITADTWLVGEDIFTPNTAGDALRYMNNPTADKDLYPPELGGSRDFYPERYTGSEDQGGVHLNSGMPNLAFQLLVEGGTHPRGKTTHTVPGIGMERAGAIFYRALTGGYFTANTNLAQARTATEQVAQELYPGCTKVAVGSAWAAVGIGTAPPADAAPPTTDITAPADGATVQPGFRIDVNANDDQCILKVEISIDGTLVKTLNAAPFTFDTDPTLAPGSHTIQVTTYDASSMSTDTATVNIAAGPGGGGVCTTNDQCADGETCQSGTCQPEGDSPGCGCASGGRGAAGSFVLFVATALLLRRRRARR